MYGHPYHFLVDYIPGAGQTIEIVTDVDLAAISGPSGFIIRFYAISWYGAPAFNGATVCPCGAAVNSTPGFSVEQEGELFKYVIDIDALDSQYLDWKASYPDSPVYLSSVELPTYEAEASWFTVNDIRLSNVLQDQELVSDFYVKKQYVKPYIVPKTVNGGNWLQTLCSTYLSCLAHGVDTPDDSGYLKTSATSSNNMSWFLETPGVQQSYNRCKIRFRARLASAGTIPLRLTLTHYTGWPYYIGDYGNGESVPVSGTSFSNYESSVQAVSMSPSDVVDLMLWISKDPTVSGELQVSEIEVRLWNE